MRLRHGGDILDDVPCGDLEALTRNYDEDEENEELASGPGGASACSFACEVLTWETCHDEDFDISVDDEVVLEDDLEEVALVGREGTNIFPEDGPRELVREEVGKPEVLVSVTVLNDV